MEDFQAPYAWVPYYTMHKLLAGLLDQHRHTEAPRPLAVATRLAEHLRRRFERVASLGLERWRTFINQEVGGMSEVLSTLALATGNSSWLQLAAQYERPCFVRPLVLQHELDRDGLARQASEAAADPASKSPGALAIEHMQ